MRLVADHYPALPGNRPRSVRISILPVAQLVYGGFAAPESGHMRLNPALDRMRDRLCWHTDPSQSSRSVQGINTKWSGYFIMSGLDSSPPMPHMFESPICACESVRLRTLLNFWLWPHNGAHSARQAVDGAAIFSAVSKSTRSAGYTIYPHAQLCGRIRASTEIHQRRTRNAHGAKRTGTETTRQSKRQTSKN